MESIASKMHLLNISDIILHRKVFSEVCVAYTRLQSIEQQQAVALCGDQEGPDSRAEPISLSGGFISNLLQKEKKRSCISIHWFGVNEQSSVSLGWSEGGGVVVSWGGAPPHHPAAH